MRARTDRDHLLRDVHVVSQAGRVNRREPFPDEAWSKVGHVQVDMAGGPRRQLVPDRAGEEGARGPLGHLIITPHEGLPLTISGETPPPPPGLPGADRESG